MTYDEIIEAMAQAIWETNSAGVEWANISGTMQAIVYVEARAALSALRRLAEKRGYRLMVPREATGGMLEMAHAAPPSLDTMKGTARQKLTAHHRAEWSAMLAAAPDPTTPKGGEG